MKQPFVSIVLVNFNGHSDTIKCLDSLKKLNYPSFEVVVVDNGSETKSVKVLEHYIKNNKKINIRLIKENKNHGFAGGNNIGVRASKADYVVLLNNDTWVNPNWLSEMVKPFSDPKVAIVGSRINNIGDFYGKKETLGNLLSLTAEPVEHDFQDKSKTFMVSGCAFMFRKGILGEPFDYDYFIYSEDTAASWLARLKGYEAVIAPESRLDHLGGQVRKRISKFLEFHGEKNRFMNMLIFFEWGTFLKLLPITLLNILFVLLVSVPKGRLFTRLKSYFWIFANFGRIMEKRSRVQSQRRVKDKELMPYMTYKLPYSVGVFTNILEKSLLAYCKLLGIDVYELQKQK